jgi:hypothetical protein
MVGKPVRFDEQIPAAHGALELTTSPPGQDLHGHTGGNV